MKIASQKLESNIAEYLLYMYQVEDLIRACKLDIEILQKNVIANAVSNEEEFEQYTAWYSKLIKHLKLQGKAQSGHLNDLEEVKMELFYLHTTLLNMLNDEVYKKAYSKAQPFIKEFQQKSKSTELNEVDTCFNALYMKLLMRLKKQTISQETEVAFEAFAEMIRLLTTSYHKMKRGDMNYMNN